MAPERAEQKKLNLSMTTRRENVAALIARARKEDSGLSTEALGALLILHVALSPQAHEVKPTTGTELTDLLKKGARELVEAGFLKMQDGGYRITEDYPGDGDVDTEVEDEDLGKLPKRANEPRAIGAARVGGLSDVPLEAIGGVDVEDAR